jgi:hypothetical protein
MFANKQKIAEEELLSSLKSNVSNLKQKMQILKDSTASKKSLTQFFSKIKPKDAGAVGSDNKTSFFQPNVDPLPSIPTMIPTEPAKANQDKIAANLEKGKVPNDGKPEIIRETCHYCYT